MSIGRRGSVRILCVALLGCLLTAGLVATPAVAKKGKTAVDLEVESDGTTYTYKVTVSSNKARCEKNRKVTVYHDQNKNQQYDAGEYIIGTGRTNEAGILIFDSTAFPPVGDGLGVIVKKNKKCKAGEFWAEVQATDPERTG